MIGRGMSLTGVWGYVYYPFAVFLIEFDQREAVFVIAVDDMTGEPAFAII